MQPEQPTPVTQIPPPPPPMYVTQQYQHQQQQMLAAVVGAANEVLYEAHTIFPFKLFTDTVKIDREKITVTTRSFFKVGEVQSLHIDDLLNVTVNVGPFFGSVRFQMRFINQKQPEEINWLSRTDALNVQKIAQGYSIARQQGIDCAALPRQQLVDMLLSLGSGDPGHGPAA